MVYPSIFFSAPPEVCEQVAEAPQTSEKVLGGNFAIKAAEVFFSCTFIKRKQHRCYKKCYLEI